MRDLRKNVVGLRWRDFDEKYSLNSQRTYSGYGRKCGVDAADYCGGIRVGGVNIEPKDYVGSVWHRHGLVGMFDPGRPLVTTLCRPRVGCSLPGLHIVDKDFAHGRVLDE